MIFDVTCSENSDWLNENEQGVNAISCNLLPDQKYKFIKSKENLIKFPRSIGKNEQQEIQSLNAIPQTFLTKPVKNTVTSQKEKQLDTISKHYTHRYSKSNDVYLAQERISKENNNKAPQAVFPPNSTVLHLEFGSPKTVSPSLVKVSLKKLEKPLQRIDTPQYLTNCSIDTVCNKKPSNDSLPVFRLGSSEEEDEVLKFEESSRIREGERSRNNYRRNDTLRDFYQFLENNEGFQSYLKTKKEKEHLTILQQVKKPSPIPHSISSTVGSRNIESPVHMKQRFVIKSGL